MIPVVPNNFKEPCKFVRVPLYKPSSSAAKDTASTEPTPQEPSERSHLEPWQREILVEFFENTSLWPTKEEAKILSQRVKRSEDCVKRWFYNKRVIVNGKKRKHKLLNHDQLRTLEEFFEEKQNPTVEEMEGLGKDLELSVIRVNSWFNCRRFKAKKESRNNSLVSKRKRVSNRRRVNYTDDEKMALEVEYKKNKYPSLEDKQRIGEKLELDVLRVHFWFLRRRSKKCKSKDENSSRTKLRPSSSSMMNKDAGTRFPESGGLTFSRSEESLFSSHRHEPLTGQEHVSQRQQVIMSNSENAGLLDGRNGSNFSESNWKTKQSCDVSDESFDFNSLAEETKTNGYLTWYIDKDLDNLVGETTLFPEIFDEPNSSLHQEEHDYMQYINMKKV